jgi:GT2 family glycosyltransferase
MNVTLCIPVLKRYDLLAAAVGRLYDSTIIPDVVIFNNGRNMERLAEIVAIGEGLGIRVNSFTPDHPSGVAKAFNFFLRNVSERRIIMNDDIVLRPDSIEKLLAVDGEIVANEVQSLRFFTIRDSCVAKVGYFDEEISPDYAYYEDCDFKKRLEKIGIAIVGIEAGATHPYGSGTMSSYTPKEMEEHHRRHGIARANYIRKWPEDADKC